MHKILTRGDYRITVLDDSIDVYGARMTIEEVEAYAEYAGPRDWKELLKEAARVAREMEGAAMRVKYVFANKLKPGDVIRYQSRWETVKTAKELGSMYVTVRFEDGSGVWFGPSEPLEVKS